MRVFIIGLAAIMVLGAIAVALGGPSTKDANELYDGKMFSIPELGVTMKIISITPVSGSRYSILVEAQ